MMGNNTRRNALILKAIPEPIEARISYILGMILGIYYLIKSEAL